MALARFHMWSNGLKELIATRTSTMAPSRIEEVLLTHPDIKQAVAYGVPERIVKAGNNEGEKGYQQIRTCIVKVQDAELTDGDVLRYLEESGWDVHTVIEGVNFVASIPKTSVCTRSWNFPVFPFDLLSRGRTISPSGDFC